MTGITKKGYRFSINGKLYTKTEHGGKSKKKHFKSKSSNINLMPSKTIVTKKLLKRSAVFEKKQHLVFNRNLLQLLKNYKSLGKKKLKIKKSPKPRKVIHFKTERSYNKKMSKDYDKGKKQLKKAKSLNRNAFRKKTKGLDKSDIVLANKKLFPKRSKTMKRTSRLKSSKSQNILVRKQLISNLIVQQKPNKLEEPVFKININKFIKNKRSQNTDRNVKNKMKEGKGNKSKKLIERKKSTKSRSQSMNKSNKNDYLAYLKKKIEQRLNEGYKGLDFRKRLKNKYEEKVSEQHN